MSNFKLYMSYIQQTTIHWNHKLPNNLCNTHHTPHTTHHTPHTTPPPPTHPHPPHHTHTHTSTLDLNS